MQDHEGQPDGNGQDNVHPLGELLLRDRLISGSQLKAALTIQDVQGGRIGEILLTYNCITPELLDDCLSMQERLREGAVNDGE